MKTIVLIEDERLSANRLIRLIEDYDDTISVIGPLRTIDEVTSFLSENIEYDLIISDIRLGGHVVFEAFELNRPKSFVVFTTAYDEYAMNAIKSNGIDYLLKPIDAKELNAALDRMKKLTVCKLHSQPLAELANELKLWRTRFLVSKGDELVPLKVDQISCFYKDERQVKAITSNGDIFIMQESLPVLEQSLDPDMFFRVNRQYIANINHLKKISNFFSSKLIIHIEGCSDENVIISKERAAKFKEWLNR